MISHAPALLLRRRTRRAVVDFCRNVIADIDLHSPTIPGAIRDLVEQSADASMLEDREDGLASPPVEALFPLQANEEQLEILERLERSAGIVVEGPPGTGKSHTIANLVAHLTASGKRVLVTSHTARALTRSPGQAARWIAQLCVDVLGEGQDRRLNLERSITELLSRSNRAEWSKRPVAARVSELYARRRQLVERRTALLAEQRRVRELEVSEFHPGIAGYAGTLSGIASLVAQSEPEFEWFGDEANGPPPEVLRSLPKLLTLLRQVTSQDVEEAGRLAPDPARAANGCRAARRLGRDRRRPARCRRTDAGRQPDRWRRPRHPRRDRQVRLAAVVALSAMLTSHPLHGQGQPPAT